MSVTQKQLAESLGLSQMTVSYALRDSELIAEKTRCRVHEAARRMGYRPNASAQAIRSGRFGCVAVLESTAGSRSSFFGGALLDGIHDGLAARDYHVIVAKLPDRDLTNEKYVPKILREFMADGLLINYFCEIPPRMVELINRYRMPAVWINSKQERDCVYLEDYGGGREATQRLIDLGHRRIGYADYGHVRPPLERAGEAAHYSIIERFQGYRDAVMEAGLPVWDLHPTGRLRHDQSLPEVQRALDAPDRPTAVVCYSEATALQFVHAAGCRGLRIPRDLSVISFGEGQRGELGVKVDCLAHGWRQVGERAAEMVLQKSDDPASALTSEALPFTYEAGDSVAPPASP